MADAPRTFVGLNLLRGLAALMVVVVHARHGGFVEFGELPASQRATPSIFFFFFSTRLGREAVLTFFVLSGFLVAGHIVSAVRDGRFDGLKYGIDRATRILIPLVPACVFTVAVSYFFFHQPFDAAQLACNMVGLNGILCATLESNGPLWTLAYEIWFYAAGGRWSSFVPAYADLCSARPLYVPSRLLNS